MVSAGRYFFLLTIFVFPYYLLPSGGFQVSSATLLATLGVLILRPSSRFVITSPMSRQFVFVCYTILVNTAWFLYTQNTDFLKYIAIGGFTCIVFFTSATMAMGMTEVDGRRLIKMVLATVVLQILIHLLGYGRPAYRAIIYFNNPNQLGYFCVICASAALMIGHLYRVTGLLIPVTIVAATVLASYSLSKAALLSCLMLAAIFVFFSDSISFLKKTLVVILIAITLVGSFDLIQSTEFYTRFEKRLNGFAPDNDDNLSQRGYGRIIDYPENIIWGSGEGYTERFNADKELHSYPATILFSYGIIGCLLFLAFLKSTLRSWRMLFYFLPIVVYNLTHHGGRTLLFWLLLGVVAGCTHDRARVSRVRPLLRGLFNRYAKNKSAQEPPISEPASD